MSKEKNQVNFANGFREPNDSDRVAAVGRLNDDEDKVWFDPDLFEPVPRPDSIDDWLAQYDEEGQTFEAFLDESPWLSERKIRGYRGDFVKKAKILPDNYPGGKIYIAQIGDVNSSLKPSFSTLKIFASVYLGFEVINASSPTTSSS